MHNAGTHPYNHHAANSLHSLARPSTLCAVLPACYFDGASHLHPQQDKDVSHPVCEGTDDVELWSKVTATGSWVIVHIFLRLPPPQHRYTSATRLASGDFYKNQLIWRTVRRRVCECLSSFSCSRSHSSIRFWGLFCTYWIGPGLAAAAGASSSQETQAAGKPISSDDWGACGQQQQGVNGGAPCRRRRVTLGLVYLPTPLDQCLLP